MAYTTGMQSKRVAAFKPIESAAGAFGRQSAGAGYEYVGTYWMSYKFDKGMKSLREGAVDAYDTVMFRCRAYVPVKRTWMLVYDCVTYQIQSLKRDYEANEIQIIAIEASGKDLSGQIPGPSDSELSGTTITSQDI